MTSGRRSKAIRRSTPARTKKLGPRPEVVTKNNLFFDDKKPESSRNKKKIDYVMNRSLRRGNRETGRRVYR